MTDIILNILPRETFTWKEFLKETPRKSISLDGMVADAPKFHEPSLHINLDHHNKVVREATMSTAMQTYYAIKGGLMTRLTSDPEPINVYLNDVDQDTSLAVWLLQKYKNFEGTQSIPSINRLLALTDRLDITGGAFPMNLDDDLIQRHNWVFEPYTSFRKSGGLASATEESMRNTLEAVLRRLTTFMLGQGKLTELDTRHEVLYDNSYFRIVNEVGGNDARYYLFSKGMDAFVSLVATRPDGRFVYTIGRRSQYIDFPVEKFYKLLNEVEELPENEGWGGSTIVGGSSRMHGSKLTWEEIRDILNKELGV